ncbi:hypothetical protein QBC38DRAFT_421985 [Podospora fimiseda]|uniref:Carbohydrate-binding module family 19 domain-containing protein n=1 Tax=Podospora fimiseda TaxID=252190 RepID=A0AAN7H0N2_9PEZI|nr:hypothetical protein QBC38DRAFT_421985 [Podospora fimiseda]
MKFTITTILTLTSTVLAAPGLETRTACTFGTYRCTNPNTGIEICDVTNNWQLVGACPNGTVCTNLPQNGYTLPFCTNPPATPTPTPKAAKRNGRGPSPGEKCSTAGQYSCFGPYAIQVCDTQNVLQFVGDCPAKSHCEYLNGIPYCVANY